MVDPALSVAQVAELRGIRTKGVLALIRSGQLRAVDVSLAPGGRPRWRILADDLDGFILRRTHDASTPRKRLRRKTKPARKWF